MGKIIGIRRGLDIPVIPDDPSISNTTESAAIAIQPIGNNKEQDETAQLRALIREAYEKFAGDRPDLVKTVTAETRMAARRASMEIGDPNSPILLNGKPYAGKDFQEGILELLREGTPLVEMALPGAKALQIGNAMMDSDYNLDIFIEAVYGHLLSGYIYKPPDFFDVTIETDTGDPVLDRFGKQIYPEFYYIKIRNRNPEKPQEIQNP